MTAINCKHQVKCPFWSAASAQCNVCKSGIFIPLDDHIEAFCTTFHYTACVQYTLHSENQINLQEKVRNSEENRRKYLRIDTSHKITLVKILKYGKLISNFSSDAQTLDMSKGGIRLLTKNPLVYDTLVQFSFDTSFPQALREITGQVQWCKKELDETGYQAGLSFQGDHVVEAMGNYLGQKHLQMQ